MTINKNALLFLSNGTPVAFVKTTSRGNYQVRVPASDPIGAADPLRIFRPDGTHYKNGLDGITLTNTATAPATPAKRGDIDVTKPLVLSDGTPVTFVKWTPKRRIQVRLPDGHPFAEGQDNGRIFFRESGKHFKGRTDLVLSNAVDSDVAPTAAPATASTANFGVVTASGSMLGDGYDSFDSAVRAATTMLADNSPLDIVEIKTVKVGTVGVTVTKA